MDELKHPFARNCKITFIVFFYQSYADDRKNQLTDVDSRRKDGFNMLMLKTEAIKLLGGTPSAAAREIGITPQAVSIWPEVLSNATRDRVQAALWRRRLKKNEVANMIQNQSNGNNAP